MPMELAFVGNRLQPDIPIIIDPLKFTYSVPGGQVDRYASGYFGYRTPTSGETTLTPLYNKVYDSSANNAKIFLQPFLHDGS